MGKAGNGGGVALSRRSKVLGVIARSASDEAIQPYGPGSLDCFATLAMMAKARPTGARRISETQNSPSPNAAKAAKLQNVSRTLTKP